jgi:Fe-S oxidoreductase
VARPRVATGFDWSRDNGLAAAAARCHGAGACRQASVDGGMCPTYQATADELHGTRGRAYLFQQVFEASDPAEALSGEDLSAALSLCLGCKACQHECPAQVDMARLKAEHLYQRYHRQRMPVAARLASAFYPLSALGARVPRLANGLAGMTSLQRLVGLARTPPPLTREPFDAWLQRRAGPSAHAGTRVVLMLDPHTAYYQPEVGRSAVGTLEALGYGVDVTRCVSTGRAAISQGALERARGELADAARAVEAVQADPEALVLGVEPSELLTLRDEATALATDAERTRVDAVAGRALLFEEFLAGPARSALVEAVGDASPRRVALHVHCHARALAGAEPIRRALEVASGHAVEVITTGCCGMAGAFGYARATADVSRAVAELELAPAVRALPNTTTVVANGISCRQQIAAMTQRRTLHPAELVAEALSLQS